MYTVYTACIQVIKQYTYVHIPPYTVQVPLGSIHIHFLLG